MYYSEIGALVRAAGIAIGETLVLIAWFREKRGEERQEGMLFEIKATLRALEKVGDAFGQDKVSIHRVMEIARARAARKIDKKKAEGRW
jgi:hypothetical protein